MIMSRTLLTPSLLLALCTLCLGCPSEPETGEVNVTVYGEEFIEDGIPASEMADGWAVDFETFVVRVDQVTIDRTQVPETGDVELATSSGGEGHTLSTMTVSTGDHTDSSYTLSDVRLRGQATKDDVTKRFDWRIDTTTRYTNCETTTTVGEGAPGTFQITVHADHFFYDSLVSEDPEVRFQALADADADGDGEITRAELEAADIGTYDPGSANDVENLWDWLEAQSATLGHVDGEGHCDFELAGR